MASSFFNDGTATTNAIAQGGSGQDLVNPGQTAYAFSTVLPDKAYATTLIDGASNVADALLGPRDKVLGIAILDANNGEESGEASSTFDFRFRGDLLLGLIEGSGEFSISANSVEIHSESFDADDSVINLGYNFGPNIDLTFSGSGVLPLAGVSRQRGSRDLDLGDDAARLRRPRLCGLSGVPKVRWSSPLRQRQDDFAVALAWAAQRLEAIDHGKSDT